MSTQSNTRPARIFLAFTYKDRPFYMALVTHLASLRQLGIIDNWHEYEIPPGRDLQQAQKERLTQADIILLLISSEFIASDYYYSVQMKQALERDAAGQVRVIPILCRPVYLEDLPIASLQFLPRSDPRRIKAVSEWVNKDKVYTEIVKEVRKAIAELFGSSPSQSPPHPGTASQPQGTRYLTYNGHSNYVISAVWSPDGKFIASGGGDNTVRIWDAYTGNTLHTYRVHENSPLRPAFASEVWKIIWSPDSTRIAFAGREIPIVWSPQENQILAAYEGHSPLLRIIASMAWSPDGEYIATTNLGSLADPYIHIWSSATGQLFTRIRMSFNISITIGGVAWAPDSRRIACGWPGEVRVYDVYTRKLVQTYRNASGVSYFYVRWSRDGSRLVCAVPKEAVVWDTTTGRLLQKYVAHKADIRDLAISPDGKYVASASNDATVHIWETDTAKRLFTYEGHKDQISSVTWLPDGKRVASASKDGTVHVWQAL